MSTRHWGLPNADLYLGDCREALAEIPDGSVDIICSDPPYGRKWIYLYEWLLTECPRVLKPAGHLLTVPHYLMPEIFRLDTPLLTYRWTCSMRQTKGNYPRLVNARKTIAVTNKPICWWTRKEPGEPDYGLVFDGVDIDEIAGLDAIPDSYENPPPDKSAHPWAQSLEWARYCLRWVNDGDVVLDPMMGTGTVGVAAAERGMHFYGIELHEPTMETALQALGWQDDAGPDCSANEAYAQQVEQSAQMETMV